jgi:hypothetical protein
MPVEGSECCHGAEAGAVEGAKAVNRRGNGLSAQTYAPLIDLAGELADAMLVALREAGVAAYASSPEPEAEPEAGGRPTAEDPLDRVYVDTSMRPAAERVLRAQLERLREQSAPGPGAAGGPAEAEPGPARETLPDTAEHDDDAIWADLVAAFEAAPQDGPNPWPDQENLDETGDDRTAGEGRDRTGRLPTVRMIEPVDASGHQDAADAAEAEDAADEDRYIPPPPPPLPRGDSVTRGAWAALLGGPLYLLLTVFLGWEVPGWAAFLSVAAFIGGFVTLVLRMGDEPRGPDDGAVV